MDKIDSMKTYMAPQINVVFVKAQGVLCQSGGINKMTIDEDGGHDFE